MTKGKITRPQIRVLEAASQPDVFFAESSFGFGIEAVGARCYCTHPTMAVLVRKGLMEEKRVAGKYWHEYRITDTGRAMVTVPQRSLGHELIGAQVRIVELYGMCVALITGNPPDQQTRDTFAHMLMLMRESNEDIRNAFDAVHGKQKG